MVKHSLTHAHHAPAQSPQDCPVPSTFSTPLHAPGQCIIWQYLLKLIYAVCEFHFPHPYHCSATFDSIQSFCFVYNPMLRSVFFFHIIFVISNGYFICAFKSRWSFISILPHILHTAHITILLSEQKPGFVTKNIPISNVCDIYFGICSTLCRIYWSSKIIFFQNKEGDSHLINVAHFIICWICFSY